MRANLLPIRRVRRHAIRYIYGRYSSGRRSRRQFVLTTRQGGRDVAVTLFIDGLVRDKLPDLLLHDLGHLVVPFYTALCYVVVVTYYRRR